MEKRNDGIEDYRYIDTRKAYVESKNVSLTSFDKYILTLASGALGISLTFINTIVPDIERATVTLLIIGWSGVIVSILSTLSSFLTSQWAFTVQIKVLDKSYTTNEEVDKYNVPGIITNALNVISIIGFIVGAFMLAIFVICNLTEGSCLG